MVPQSIFLFSECRNEIYLTFGTLDRHYLKYLQSKQRTTRFLRLHTYGPWWVGEPNDMRQISEIILAYALRVKGRAVGRDWGPDEQCC